MFVFFSYIFSTCLFKRLFYIYLRWYVTYEMVTIPSEKCNVNVIIARYMCSYFLLSSLSDWNLFTFGNVFVCIFPSAKKLRLNLYTFPGFNTLSSEMFHQHTNHMDVSCAKCIRMTFNSQCNAMVTSRCLLLLLLFWTY